MLAELATDLVIAETPSEVVYAANGRPRRSAADVGAKKRQRLEETDGVEYDLAEPQPQQPDTKRGSAKKSATASDNVLVSPEPTSNAAVDGNAKSLTSTTSAASNANGEKLTPLLVDGSEETKPDDDSDDEPLIVVKPAATKGASAAASTRRASATATKPRTTTTTNHLR